MVAGVDFKPITINPMRFNMSEFVLDVRREMTTWADNLILQVLPYPPQRPGSHYLRTGKLFAGWKVLGPVYTEGNLVASVTNAASDRNGYYMQLVQAWRQRPMHAETGWTRVDIEAMRLRTDFYNRMDHAVRRNIRRAA